MTADPNPKHIVVVGAGLGGLGAALALARDSHRVTIVEQDAAAPATDLDTAAKDVRRGIPQAHHSHLFLARMRHVLRSRFPDLLADWLAAGATESSAIGGASAPADGADESADDDLVAVQSRRSTFEWVLRRTVGAEPNVELRAGASCGGLTVAATPCDGVPAVNGVRLGTGEIINADLVAVATGRRSALPTWLAEHGVTVHEHETKVDQLYLSRFYRSLDGTGPPSDPIGVFTPALRVGVFAGDNGTFSITLGSRVDDRELRAHLLDADQFEAALRLIPNLDSLTAPGVAEPISDVHVMAGLINRLRRYRDRNRRPIVVGVHAVGDAHTTTNADSRVRLMCG